MLVYTLFSSILTIFAACLILFGPYNTTKYCHSLFETVRRWLIRGLFTRICRCSLKYASGGNKTLMKDLSLVTFEDLQTLRDLAYAELTGSHDDASMLMERMIQFLHKMPDNSLVRRQLSKVFVRNLWESMPHPSFRGLPNHSKYREPALDEDSLYPLGYSGSKYSRIVPVGISPGILPDPGLVFDLLLARDGKHKEHPSRISSMLFYLAAIVNHDILQTNSKRPDINMTSSYLDLSPLYGRNKAEQTEMRQFKDGFLKFDCFSSKELLLLPPGTGVFLVMFNRFHNYVARQLSLINEGGRFDLKPVSSCASDLHKAQNRRDEELFQTARLITCGLYMNIILNDYVGTMLNLNRTVSTWSLDPRDQERQTMLSSQIPHSMGNNCSVEFNLIYRWHSCLSERDAHGLQDRLRSLLDGRNPTNVTVEEAVEALRAFEENVPEAVQERSFGDFKRQPDGYLSDGDLFRELTASIEDVAGAFGANRVPVSLRALEIMSIIQARKWHVATLNEFRDFFGLSRHETFQDINPDLKVAKNLQAIYRHPDAVELYPGVVIEKTKPEMSPGSGICAGFTVSRAMLYDIVSLVRSDRFYMQEWNPLSVTAWGFNEASPDKDINGGLMHKLILRAFPKHFEPNSVYAHFPFVIPEEGRNILERLSRDHDYSFSTPEIQLDSIVVNDTMAAIASREACRLPRSIMSKHAQGVILRNSCHTIQQLLRDNSVRHRCNGSTEIDIIQDIANPLFSRLIANLLSITLSKNPDDGFLTENTLSNLMKSIHAAEASHDPTRSLRLQKISNAAVEKVRTAILKSRPKPTGTTLLHRLFGTQHSGDLDHSMCPGIRALACEVMTLLHLVIESVDYYMSEGADHLPELQKLAAGVDADTLMLGSRNTIQDGKPNALETMLRYMLEGSRLAMAREALSFHRIIPKPTPGVLNISAVSRDPFIFSDPCTIRLDRQLSSYHHHGISEPALRSPLIQASLALFISVISLNRLRPGLGEHSNLKRIRVEYSLARPVNKRKAERRDSGVSMSVPSLKHVDTEKGLEDWLQIDHLHVAGTDVNAPAVYDLKSNTEGVTVYLADNSSSLAAVPKSFRVAWDHGA